MDAQVLISAFLMGLAGSLHCIGMCGPIALSLPTAGKTAAAKVTGALLYNFGRITTYAAFGLVFGWVGRSFAWFGWQQKISILLGAAILVFLLFPVFFPGKTLHPVISRAMAAVRNQLAKTIFRASPQALYTTGILNGLLPCGLVYMALTGAAITGDPVKGMSFMALFGAGTLPAMFATGFFGQWLKQPVRLKMRQLYPALMAIMAMLLILRGLNLGIPLVSPKINASSSESVVCNPNDQTHSFK
jgi:sulfite exporter TauE/SafE